MVYVSLDKRHQETLGVLTGIEFDERSQTRANVTFESRPASILEDEDDEDVEDEETDGEQKVIEADEEVSTDGGVDAEVEVFEDYRTNRFGLTQLLKFAGMRKRDLKETVEVEDGDNYTRTRPDASEMVMDELEGEPHVFKFDREEEQLLSVVSPNYATINSDELDQLVQNKIAEMGFTDEPDRYVERRGFVVEIDYSWSSEHSVETGEVDEKIDGGISIRNSVFGASSLRINKFYTIIACVNGMRVRESGSELRQIHMGDASELREKFEQRLEQNLEDLWEETRFIERSAAIQMPLEDQVEWVELLAENGRITKTAAERIVEELESDESEWNLGRESAWNLVNALTGYATHERESISDSAMKNIRRVYNDVLTAENENEVMAVAE